MTGYAYSGATNVVVAITCAQVRGAHEDVRGPGWSGPGQMNRGCRCGKACGHDVGRVRGRDRCPTRGAYRPANLGRSDLRSFQSLPPLPSLATIGGIAPESAPTPDFVLAMSGSLGVACQAMEPMKKSS